MVFIHVSMTQMYRPELHRNLGWKKKLNISSVSPKILLSLACSRLLRNLAREQLHSTVKSSRKTLNGWIISGQYRKKNLLCIPFWQNIIILRITNKWWFSRANSFSWLQWLWRNKEGSWICQRLVTKNSEKIVLIENARLLFGRLEYLLPEFRE